MKLSLSARLALLFAACTALVSLVAGLLFNAASEAHFLELDQQLLDSRMASLRGVLVGVEDQASFEARRSILQLELARQPDEGLRVFAANGASDGAADSAEWFNSRPALPAAAPTAGLETLHTGHGEFRTYSAPLDPRRPKSPRLTLLLDITHHQHFLQRMQGLIWLTVGLSALATALLGAWAARLSLRPLRRMTELAAGVSAQSLTTRLPMQGLPPELADLGQSLNAMLARLDDAFTRLSAFSADIAHELRTPLSNLLTHTQVTLTRPRSAADYEEALHSNLEDLQWMAQLVNDMLYLAKAEHGLMPAGREPLSLANEVDGLLEFFAPLAEEAGVRLLRQGDADVQGDRGMLRRALSNLLANALRFTSVEGQVRISLTHSDGQVIIEVANQGEAIPEPALARLFDRFYRADSARSASQSEHAGLGLAITRSIVRAHGGSITCKCTDGWTRFKVLLPIG
ncbi:heavy metal sensor histidine kinase [Pseudomonas sp. MWU16-30317]|uniref:heavy metal sensor histidine kinase n=1 Tax=Pseudomonas sp. MWU16-30317 TaxID=2878095 RepID=UPI001CFBAD81|nr:heavy metal sensor histidine kinase [Pseudomonas sp. MWU16-30317]